MATKPELQINTSLNTTLKKFGGFLKILALIGVIGGATVGTNYLTTSAADINDVVDNRRRDSLINVIQNDVKQHDLRLNVVENTNIEVKASLVDIQKDIKTLLYISGKNEGYNAYK